MKRRLMFWLLTLNFFNNAMAMRPEELNSFRHEYETNEHLGDNNETTFETFKNNEKNFMEFNLAQCLSFVEKMKESDYSKLKKNLGCKYINRNLNRYINNKRLKLMADSFIQNFKRNCNYTKEVEWLKKVGSLEIGDSAKATEWLKICILNTCILLNSEIDPFSDFEYDHDLLDSSDDSYEDDYDHANDESPAAKCCSKCMDICMALCKKYKEKVSDVFPIANAIIVMQRSGKLNK